jgi:phosphonate transport system substrate-binding protein
MWLKDNYDKTILDLSEATPSNSYGDIALGLASETCDVGVGYADIRRDYADKWMTEWGRTEDIWNETDVIGVTEGIFNDTISVSLNSPDYSEKLATALQEAFIEIAQTDAGKEAIAIYNHEGYQVVTDADYDGARKAADVVQAS